MFHNNSDPKQKLCLFSSLARSLSTPSEHVFNLLHAVFILICEKDYTAAIRQHHRSCQHADQTKDDNKCLANVLPVNIHFCCVAMGERKNNAMEKVDYNSKTTTCGVYFMANAFFPGAAFPLLRMSMSV